MIQTKEFFNEAFKGFNVPSAIRNTSEEICKQFDIKGICDPMYIANVTAYELGMGDGQGNFNGNAPQLEKFETLANRLKFAYGCNITEVGRLTAILDKMI